MGAEILKFDGTFSKDNYLKDFRCPQCQQPISEQDIQQKNYMLWVSDYANEITKDFYDNSPLYGLNFWLKAVEHEYCPETETCQNCYERLLTVTMRKIASDYYCVDCVNKEVKHE